MKVPPYAGSPDRLGRPDFLHASNFLFGPSGEPQRETFCPMIDLVSDKEGVQAVAKTHQRQVLHHGVQS